MSELEKLQQKLASVLTENEFLLDPRTVGDLLNNMAEYTRQVPFFCDSKACWESFWMAECSPDALSEFYQDPSLANKKLPVQQAFLLALLQLLETPRVLLNTLPARHRSLYYRDLLGFSPRDNQPDSVAVNFTLQKNTAPYRLPGGSLLDGGQDGAGNSINYQTDDSLLITGQQLNQLCWTRPDTADKWKLCTVIDTDKTITLPAEGMRLFTATDNETESTDIKEQALYLGFSGVCAQESLSVYWSLRASSALDLCWWYYQKSEKSEKSQWASLDAVVQDDTAGLSVSNLWRARLPEDIQPGRDGLASEYYWIKATLAEESTLSVAEMPKLQALLANAMTATLNMEQQVDDQHFLQALPANTISQLVSPVAAISSINQPLPSTGGQPRETDTALLQRAATRIAHRQRAITWDNMRSLLMEQYPQIFDVRFPDVDKLNHIPALKEQMLMVIPDSRYCDNDDALRPALSSGRLALMAQWLGQYTPQWAEPTLNNPTYIEVTARYQVIFVAGIHPDYGYHQLATQLQQQYMPWGEDQRLAVTPGNKVDYYRLLATLQQSPLVQRVVSLVLNRSGGEETQQTLIAKDDEVLILCPEGDSDV